MSGICSHQGGTCIRLWATRLEYLRLAACRASTWTADGPHRKSRQIMHTSTYGAAPCGLHWRAARHRHRRPHLHNGGALEERWRSTRVSSFPGLHAVRRGSCSKIALEIHQPRVRKIGLMSKLPSLPSHPSQLAKNESCRGRRRHEPLPPRRRGRQHAAVYSYGQPASQESHAAVQCTRKEAIRRGMLSSLATSGAARRSAQVRHGR